MEDGRRLGPDAWHPAPPVDAAACWRIEASSCLGARGQVAGGWAHALGWVDIEHALDGVCQEVAQLCPELRTRVGVA